MSDQRMPPPAEFDSVRLWMKARYNGTKGNNGTSRTQYSEPANVLRRAVYCYACVVERDGLLAALRAHVTVRDGQDRWRAHDSPFVWALRLFHKGKTKFAGNESKWSKTATELDYAFKHRIHWIHLDPFLILCGGYHGIKKRSQASIEEIWVKGLTIEARQQSLAAHRVEVSGEKTANAKVAAAVPDDATPNASSETASSATEGSGTHSNFTSGQNDPLQPSVS